MKQPVYSVDGSAVLVPKFSPQQAAAVPVDLLDHLMESEVSILDVQEALFFRRVTKGKNFEWVDIDDLVGVDLSGKTVHVFYANWEDSEWLVSDEMRTVEKIAGSDENDVMYSFVKSSNASDYDLLDDFRLHSKSVVLITYPVNGSRK